MKLGKNIFSILGSIVGLTTIGLTSCGSISAIEFIFNPNIENIETKSNPYYERHGSYKAFVCQPYSLTISKKNGNFLDGDALKLKPTTNKISFEVLEGEQAIIHHIEPYYSGSFKDGKYVSSSNVLYFCFELDKFPTSHVKWKYVWDYDMILDFTPLGEKQQEFRIEHCILKGTINYTPSKEN